MPRFEEARHFVSLMEIDFSVSQSVEQVPKRHDEMDYTESYYSHYSEETESRQTADGKHCHNDTQLVQHRRYGIYQEIHYSLLKEQVLTITLERDLTSE